jgi:hypothetical protein
MRPFCRELRNTAPYDEPSTVENVACSGDTTAAFASSISHRRPQLDAVNKGFGVIFLSTGGDDLDFKQIVQQCLIQKTRDGHDCEQHLDEADKMLSDGVLRSRVSGVLDAIHARASRYATIALVGYPYIEGKERYLLPWDGHRPIDVPARLKAIGDLGDQIEQAAVNGLNVKYHTNKFVFVNTKALFAGHELLALRLNPKRWFVDPVTDSLNHDVWYHPDPTGWAKEAQLLLRDPLVPKINPIPEPTRRMTCGRFIIGRADSSGYPGHHLPASGHEIASSCTTLERIARRLYNGSYKIPDGAGALGPAYGPPFPVIDQAIHWSCRLQLDGSSGPTFATKCASGSASLYWHAG